MRKSQKNAPQGCPCKNAEVSAMGARGWKDPAKRVLLNAMTWKRSYKPPFHHAGERPPRIVTLRGAARRSLFRFTPRRRRIFKRFVRTSKLLGARPCCQKSPQNPPTSFPKPPKNPPKIHPQATPNRSERPLGDHLGPVPPNKSILEAPKYQNGAKMEFKI